MMTINKSITEDRVIDACRRDDGTGFCSECGEEQGCCEPDARNYRCESCGTHSVHGAFEYLLML